jgi:hypothetical protein
MLIHELRAQSQRVALVCFYDIGENGIPIVSNGLSWVHSLIGGEHVNMKSGHSIEQRTLGFDAVCVSKHTLPDTLIQQGKVFYGGPRSGPMEDAFGVELSGEWSYSSFDDMESDVISVNVSIGVGCAWGRCIYCMDKQYQLGCRLRPNWDTVLASDFCNGKVVDTVDLCMPGPPKSALERLIEIRKMVQARKVITFADAKELEFLFHRPFRSVSLNGITFRIGLESKQDSILKAIGRSSTTTQVLDLCERIINMGGQVSIMMMDPTPREMERPPSRECEDRILTLVERGMEISENGPTVWPTSRVAAKFGKPVYTKIGWLAK